MKKYPLTQSEIDIIVKTQQIDEQVRRLTTEAKYLNAKFWKDVPDRVGYFHAHINFEKMELEECKDKNCRVQA